MFPMRSLLAMGQSVWLDYLRRGLTRSGELASMVDDGLRGMTSNQTIFEQAIATGEYDEAIAGLTTSSASNSDIFESLSTQDVREAADVFRKTYDETSGADGFVSIEVSPRLAYDTEGTIGEARRLWKTVDRPNAMVKIPGTREGWPAIERCLRDGININVTLLFSLEHYLAVASAYMNALEARLAAGQTIDRVASAASIFVSRVDSEVDKRIVANGDKLTGLKGKTAIANARLIYDAFVSITNGERWKILEAHGAKFQRPLWASTGTKNHQYSDVLYVESLIGPSTITTVPPDTLALFADHGVVAQTLPGDVATARRTMEELEKGGISFGDVSRTLENEGIAKFTTALNDLLARIGEKRNSLSTTRGSQSSTQS
jgi:transaldolase